ncbi:hypothetical protein Drorol1_Dr00020288, partial [Drosera rotundifolia]
CLLSRIISCLITSNHHASPKFRRTPTKPSTRRPTRSRVPSSNPQRNSAPLDSGSHFPFPYRRREGTQTLVLMDDDFDIVRIYKRFCDIRAGTAYLCNEENISDESGKGSCVKQAFTELSMFIASTLNLSASIYEQLLKLMSQLNLMGDFTEFSNFYDFVFFICRENGQKRITVSRAVSAWRLVLAGRFRLLNHWCDFVEKNQRHNISEDTWRQVLAFSRCVHEDLEGYDAAGAWPVLVDDFVEHMYRITGSNKSVLQDAACSCNDGDGKPHIVEDSLPGLKRCPGLKRKSSDDLLNFCSSPLDGSVFSVFPSKCRKSEKQWTFHKDRPPLSDSDDLQGIAKQISSFSIGPSCAIEGYLSKGFASLLSSRPSVQLDQEMRVPWRIE